MKAVKWFDYLFIGLIVLSTVFVAIIVYDGKVFAYDPPNQSSDNATDVILWHGDSSNVTLSDVTISSLTLAENTELTINGLTDAINDFKSDLIWLLLCALVSILAFWHRDKIIYIVAGLTFGIYAFTWWSDSNAVSIGLFLVGIAIFIKAFIGGKKE